MSETTMKLTDDATNSEVRAAPGRVCPLRYRYGASAIAHAETRQAQTLYVIGGLYGNVPALDEIERMASAEHAAGGVAPTLCFNGDFNWFNVADERFAEINRRVLAHDAIAGNVEAEFDSAEDDAGCGCAYPDSVDTGVVERSNLIHAQLKATARRHPDFAARIAKLPMFARYQIGDCRIGVVHGDADSLAGWRFDVDALDDPVALAWLQSAFRQANVDVFASTHTCLPAMRAFARTRADAGAITGVEADDGWVVNNGATGMPNFSGDGSGLCTRVGLTPSPHPVAHEIMIHGVYVALLPVRFDEARWRHEFLAQWPEGSAAWVSYWKRITLGPGFAAQQALPRRQVV
jgi:hypothetical protein